MKKVVPIVCPACELGFTISTAMDEKKFCSLACESGNPKTKKQQKRNRE